MSAALMTLVLTTSCARSGDAAMAGSANDAPVPTVAAAKTYRTDLSNDLTLTAEFEPYQDVDVMAKVSGYVRDIKVDIGDRVHRGELLATLEIPEMQDDLARASASIDEATADLGTAQDELKRAQSAEDIAHLSFQRIQDVARHEKGLIPQQEVDEAESRDLGAQAEVASAKSRIASSEERIRVAKAEQARVKTLQQYTLITAPFDGVITKRYANVGSMIQAGISSQTQAMPVVRLSENGLLRLIVPVPESAVASIHLGQQVVVSVGAIHRTFDGKVTRFADTLLLSTRTMDTEVDVPNPDLVLIPGMYAEVRLTMQDHPKALTVPLDAIDGAGSNSQRAYVIGPDHTVRVVNVTTGLENSDRVEVLAGLQDGDMVVIGRHAELRQGERVRPRLVESDKPDGPRKD